MTGEPAGSRDVVDPLAGPDRPAPSAGPVEPDGPPGGSGPVIRLQGVDLEFPRSGTTPLPVLDGIDLAVAPGEIVALIGPSGCGKSTILNMVAGSLQPTGGTFEFDGAPLRKLNTAVSYMTQKDTLLAWRRVRDNAALPLEIRGVGRRERREQAEAVLARVGLAGFEGYLPHQLSGGMRSRLSLARALLSDARVFLMDEPFGALDAFLRIRMQQLLMELWAERRMTVVYVTHDLTEAIGLAHRVVVLSSRPARIKAVRTIPYAFPRDIAAVRTEPDFNATYQELWDLIAEDLDAEAEGGRGG
ncbi:MAG: ABC transporter ATP-binding protein [Acidimicrobiia bacterium]